MTAPSFTNITLVVGTNARAEDIDAMMLGVASYLGAADAVTTDTIQDSAGITIVSTDNHSITINVPNAGGGGKLWITVGGVNVFSIDGSGNARFKGTVTPSVTP